MSIGSRVCQLRPFSSGSVRCEMSTGTDWPRLEDPLDHFSELDPSHVHALLEDLEPFCCCHSLKSWTRPIHGCSSWISQYFNHRGIRIMHVCNPFAILLWTDHHLLVSLCWLRIIDMAIFPWRWNLRKAMCRCQDCIELLDHVCLVTEGHRCIEITIPGGL